MVKELKKYPDESINVNAGPIRDFKSNSFKYMLQDLIDTAKKHNLEALSAIEIGYPYHLMIIKENDEYKVYANARIIRQSEPFLSTETAQFFHNMPITVKRFKNLSIIYEDENGNNKQKIINDKNQAATFQRTLDYLFNTTLLDRLLPHQREQAMKALAKNGHALSLDEALCPTNSKKDYFPSIADKLLFFMFISLLLPLFGVSKETISSWYSYDKFAFWAVNALMVGFFFYAQYEAKKYRQCTSCQLGNQIGIIIIRVAINIVLITLAYFIIKPN
jgi:peptide deformylase